MTRLSLSLLVLTLAACSGDKTTGTDVDTRQTNLAENQVTAERVAEGVRVTNGSGVEIRYLVKNANWLGLLAGCHHEPSTCATLVAGGSVVVKSADVIGYHPDVNTIDVWYWVEGAGDPDGKSIQVK